jgi:hypothetical protein
LVDQRVVGIEARETAPASAAEPARVSRLEPLRGVKARIVWEGRWLAEAGKPVVISSYETRNRNGKTFRVSRATWAIPIQIRRPAVATARPKREIVVRVLVRIETRGEAAAGRAGLPSPLGFGRALALHLQARAVGGAHAAGGSGGLGCL